MKKIISTSILASLLIISCDYNDNFDGLDELVQPSDVKSIEYTLADEDYATIATNKENQAIATENGVLNALTNLSSNKYFTEIIEAETYVPAFLANKWFTADNGSSVKVTYNQMVSAQESTSEANNASIYRISNTDYQSVWGEGVTTNFFTPATPPGSFIPGILGRTYPDAEVGNMVVVDYNYSENEPSGVVVPVNEDFNQFTGTVYVADVEGWNNVITIGTYAWTGRLYSNNGYLQASAYGHNAGESEAYMITPRFNVSKGLKFSFDACYANYVEAGGKLSVLITTDLTGYTPEEVLAATWIDITDNFPIEIPSATYGELKNVGEIELDEYFGENIHIAFKYYGNNNTGETTGVQIDNVVIKSEGSGASEDTYIATAALYRNNGTSWSAYASNTTYLLTRLDYDLMGISYDNFSSSLNPDHYLPIFLNNKFAYAQENDVKTVVYKYYASSVTSVRADEYIFTNGGWAKHVSTIVTDQFVLSDGKWNFDPSIVLTLMPTRNNPAAAPFYQAIVDYVAFELEGAGEDYYQVGSSIYTNAEYYYGASAYNCNFDFRITAWRNQNTAGPTVYAGLDDTELEALMYERLLDAFIPGLKEFYSDMAPIDGIEVKCTINFGIYEGTTIADCTHQIEYKVTGAGEFEYIDGSFKSL